MTCSIASKSIAHQWSGKVCSVIDFSLGQGIAQKRALLPVAGTAHQWRNHRLARTPSYPLCAASALPSATLGGAPLADLGSARRAFTRDQHQSPHTVEIEDAHEGWIDLIGRPTDFGSSNPGLTPQSASDVAILTPLPFRLKEHIARNDGLCQHHQWLGSFAELRGNVGVTTSPAASAGETADRAEMLMFRGKNTRVGWGWQANETSAAIIDLDRIFRGPVLQNPCVISCRRECNHGG